jgi:zinc protease
MAGPEMLDSGCSINGVDDSTFQYIGISAVHYRSMEPGRSFSRSPPLGNSMKNIAVSALMIAFAAFAAAQANTPATPVQTPAGAPSAPTPSVDEVLSHQVQALGGKAALDKLTSTSEKGTFELPDFGSSGQVELFAKTGDKQLTNIELEGFGTVKRGYDGTAGWADDPQGGLRDLTGDELADMRRSSAWNAALRMKALYPGLAVTGSDKVKGHDAWVLETTIDDLKYKLYFDEVTGLLVRHDQETKTPDGTRSTVVIYFDDYKPVDGVPEPFTLSYTSPQLNWTMKLAEVKHNDPIDDAKFAKPAGDAPAPKPAETPAK